MRRFALALVCTLALGCSQNVQRYGSVIGVKAETLDKYKALHAAPWPEINAKIKECHIRNYSIYLTQFPDGNHYLFSYFEYTGDDFDADMQKIHARGQAFDFGVGLNRSPFEFRFPRCFLSTYNAIRLYTSVHASATRTTGTVTAFRSTRSLKVWSNS